MSPGRALDAGTELPVALEELFGGAGETHSAPWAAAGRALDEFEASRALELAEIPPGIPVGHSEDFGGLLQRTVLFDQLEQACPALAELQVISESDPCLDLRSHRDTIVRDCGPGSQCDAG